MNFAAVTAYGVPIVGGQKHDRKAALEWARINGDYFAGSRVIQMTKRGPRTIWKHEEKQS